MKASFAAIDTESTGTIPVGALAGLMLSVGSSNLTEAEIEEMGFVDKARTDGGDAIDLPTFLKLMGELSDRDAAMSEDSDADSDRAADISSGGVEDIDTPSEEDFDIDEIGDDEMIDPDELR
jgi:Ca2+-binding EF-hand superfamily protein